MGRHSSAIIRGIKCALAESGLCDDVMAEPFQRSGLTLECYAPSDSRSPRAPGAGTKLGEVSA